METATYAVGVPAIVTAFFAFAWWQWRRMSDKQDKEEADAAAEIKASFIKHQENIDSLRNKIHDLELGISVKIGQDNMADFFNKIDDIRLEVKKDIETIGNKQDNLLGQVITALAGLHKGTQ
jgi:H+/gluconate symporter-like permease